MIKLFHMEVEQVDDILIGGTCNGDLLLSLTKTGSFNGEKLKGSVLPVGVSTTYTPASGVNVIHAPLLLQTDDDVKIFMQIDAYLHLLEELEDKLLAGKVVCPEEYYYKGTVTFQVGNLKYKWLERKVFVCEGVIHTWEKLQFVVYEM